MNDRLKPLLLSFFWVFCLAVNNAHAGLSARLDRDSVSEGETVRLLVEADRQVSGRPNTEPLVKDFDILGVASGSRVNIINGRMDARTTWTISLAPKRNGKLTIPALELNGERTSPLTLQVSETPVAAGAVDASPLFIETEVDRRDPYVQGMVRYTVRLFLRVRLAEGSLSEPQPDNALVRRLGEDREYRVERAGNRYKVVERQYAIFPQASGELLLPAPVLDARVADKSSRRQSPLRDFFGRDPFDDPFFSGNPLGDVFTATRPLRVRGEAQVLNVRPRPSEASGHQWLPAEHVELDESWLPEDGEIHVGDLLTRTVSIRARGVTGEQLPDLDPGGVDGFKVYPDRAKANTRELNQGVEGEKDRSIAFVPIRPGSYVLPAMRLHWWDTQSDRQRVAELPERAIEVLPGAEAQAAPLRPSGAAQDAVDLEPPFSATVSEDAPHQVPADQIATKAHAAPAGLDVWPWISLAFAFLWLLTLGLWWGGRQRPAVAIGKRSADRSHRRDTAKARASFLSACRANDPRGARENLLAWAAGHWHDDPPAGLDDIVRRLADPRAARALADLDRTLYGGKDKAWNGNALAQVLSRLPGRGTETRAKTPLPDLYA